MKNRRPADPPVGKEDIPAETRFSTSDNRFKRNSRQLTKGFQVIDLGPTSRDLFKYYIKRARTVFWNGPLGYIEQASARRGTCAIAKAIAQSKAFTVLGGGDITYALKLCKLQVNDFSHVSTGGGAFLEFLEGKKLPAVAMLEERAQG